MLPNLKVNITFLLCATIVFLPLPTHAQISPDGTTSTTVTTEGNISTINDGNRVGNNLFHSFSDFSVLSNGTASFNNAVDVTNIINRVTGGNVSNIDGLIRANGSANLFLINPAGIIFGSGASLNIGGSFLGSTADSIVFPEGIEFSATDTQTPPLLTINAPIGLNFRDNPADIQVQGQEANLTQRVQNLTLVGGDISFNGANIFAPGSRVELGGLSAAGTVNLDEDLSLSFPEDVVKADVFLEENSSINVRSNGGGLITVNANNLTLTEASQLLAGIGNNTGTADAQAGDIVISVDDTVSLDGGSSIANSIGSNGLGNAGDIDLNATNLSLANSSTLGSQTLPQGQGNTGTVRINVSDSLSLDSSSIRTQILEGAVGNAGNVEIFAGSIELSNNSLEISNPALIFSSTLGEGNAGNLIINANDSISLQDSSIFSQVQTNATGNAGNIEIATGSLSIVSLIDPSEVINNANDPTTIDSRAINSRIFTNTVGIGNAGDISIEVADNILLDRGSITSQVISGAEGNAGTITINTGTATLQSSTLLLGTNAQGNAGNLFLNARDNIFVDGNSLIVSQVRPGAIGDAGNIEIFAGDLFSARDFSLISTNTQEEGTGNAGSLTLTANNVSISDGAILDSLTENDGNAGSITVNAQTLDLTAGGKIVTTTDGNGNAGNITLNIANTTNIDGSNAPSRPPGQEFDEQVLNDLETQTGLFANATERSQGISGTLTINTESLSLDNQAQLLAETRVDRPDPQTDNITLNVEDILSLDGDSKISAQAFGNANGGNIEINAEFVLALSSENQGNDIIASAQQGTGGNITINTQGIFGLEEGNGIDDEGNSLNNGTNDIDASSELGPEFNGIVEINTPDVDATKGVSEAAPNVVEPEETVAQTCSANIVAGGSRLTVKGKGNVPPELTEPITSDTIIINGESASIGLEEQPKGNIELQTTRKEKYPPITTAQGEIYPARGMIIQENGDVILTSYPTPDNSQRSIIGAHNCSASRASIQ